MGVCFYGILWIVIPDLPQVAEVAEIAEEEKSHVAILKSNVDAIVAYFPFNRRYTTETSKVQ